MIETARLIEVDPQAWLADVLTELVARPADEQLGKLVPWNWTAAH